jgi:hypothetical protein
MSDEDQTSALKTKPSDSFHYHECAGCGHGWGCTSSLCLYVRELAESPKLRIRDTCRSCFRRTLSEP